MGTLIEVTDSANEMQYPTPNGLVRVVTGPPEMWNGHLSHLQVWRQIRRRFIAGPGRIVAYFTALTEFAEDPMLRDVNFASDDDLVAFLKMQTPAGYQCVLSGHGYHRVQDGSFIVPEGVTIVFFCPDASMTPGTMNDRYADVARVAPQQIGHAGRIFMGNGALTCKDYRMIPLYGSNDHRFSSTETNFLYAEPFDPLKRQCVIGVKRYSVPLSQIVAHLRERLVGMEIILYWAACREAMTDDTHAFAVLENGFMTQMTNVDMDASLPGFSDLKQRWRDTVYP
jgi:hypothetical protein